MKKKKMFLIITVVLLIVGVYFGYKIFNLYYYNLNSITVEQYEGLINGLSTKNIMTIKTNTLPDAEYLSHNNIKVKNDFENFKKLDNSNSTDDFVKYVLYDDDDKVISSFWMGTTDMYIDMFEADVTIYGADDKQFKNIDFKKFFEKNNITNDIELFKFLVKNKDVENNIFTSVNAIKNKYSIQLLSTIALPKMDSLTLINGDYTGYIFNLGSTLKEVSLLKHNKRYIFTFIGLDYFTDDDINEILNSVVID